MISFSLFSRASIGLLLFGYGLCPTVSSNLGSDAPANVTAPAVYKSQSYYGLLPQSSAAAPLIEHGNIVQFKHAVNVPNAANIYEFDLNGNPIHAFSIWPEGSSLVWLSSVDRGEDGVVAFSGTSRLSDGTIRPFIGTADDTGTHLVIQPTGLFVPTLVKVDVDDSIWSCGYELPKVIGGKKRWDNYPTMRHFTKNGLLLEAILQRWSPEVAYVVPHSLAAMSDVDAYSTSGRVLTSYASVNQESLHDFSYAWNTKSKVFLGTYGKWLILYEGLNGMFYKYDTSAHTLLQYKFAVNVSALGLNSFLVSDDGKIYASLARPSTSDINETHGILELVVDDATHSASWNQVKSTFSEGHNSEDAMRLVGAPRDSLVYETRQPEHAPRSFSWMYR